MFEPAPFQALGSIFMHKKRKPEPDALGIWHHLPKQARKKKKVHKSEIGVSDNFDTCEEMDDLMIPPFLQHSYINGLPTPKINELRPWQKELVASPDWRAGKSGIVLVPTSGGKTVAADIAVAQLLMNDPDAKALYALPFVSLASEKTNEFKNRFFKHSVRPFYQNIGGSDFRRGSIAVCTFEKAHALLNAAIRDGYVSKIKLIVIDEIHMINEDQRGAVIESLILKCLLLREKHEIRIIGLTATLNVEDTKRIASWIGGFYYISESRPSRIKNYFKSADGKLYLLENGKSTQISEMRSIPEDKRHILAPIRALLLHRKVNTVLIFVNNRKQTVSVANFIASHLYDDSPFLPKIDPQNEFLQSERNQLIQRLSKTEAGLDVDLGKCVRAGVGFHHAGMLLEERKLIEEAAKESTISVVVATTTLSAGINIRSVGRVIIYEAYRFTPEDRHKLLPPSLFRQMAGRAGRDESQGGDVVIIGQQPKDSELTDAINLTSKTLEDIRPHLLEEGLIDRFFLQCISTKLVTPDYDGAHLFVETSLFHFLNPDFESQTVIDGLMQRLQSAGLIGKDMKATDLGMAIAESAMSIEEGLELQKIIHNVEHGLSLEDDVHMLYLCIPTNAINNEKTPEYESTIWELLIHKHEPVIKMIVNLDSSTFQRHIIQTMAIGGKYKSEEMKRIDRELDRVYFACLLQELIAEEPLNNIVKKFKVSRGVVQALQLTSANFAGQTAKFCERIKCPLLGTALSAFRKRLDFGVQSDILPLLRLPSCTKPIARILASNHLSSPADVSEISCERLAVLISKKGEPDEQEELIAKRLKEEASKVAKSLAFLDVLEDYAIQNMMIQETGIEIV